MIRFKNLYDFMEGNFDYLLILDDEERLIHASDLFRKDCLPDGYADNETTLEGLVSDFSLRTFRSAMAKAKAGNRVIAVFSPSGDEACSIPLKAGHAALEKGGVYVFFGNKFEGLSQRTESEKDARIKELACLYKVMEWIEVSPSIKSFFTELPRYLSSGLLYPEEVVVHSVYEGIKYGQEPSKDNHISVTLVVGGKEKGVIQVGYLDEKHHLLPEEQKMLNEIGRTLNFALERREYRDKLRMKQDEEKEFSNRLKKLESEITTRTAELEEQREKLNVVNSYLDRVSDGWEESKGRLETMFEAIPDEVVLIDKSHRIVMTNRDDVQAGGHCYEYRDVTLEKTYEQQLQQADKLASLGQLVSGIGHEINNPNQFIRGNIKIMKQSLDDMLPIVDDHYGSHPDLKIARLKYDFFREHIMTLVDDMAHGSERIKSIVESLRTFARKDEGLLVDTVDINTLIEASARLVHNEVHKRAEIELDLAPDLPTFIGNSQKIEQVLINLLVNAGQAMPDDGKGLIKVRTTEDKGNIVVEMKDNGKGMTEKTRKMIFDPFFTTKRAKGGTGLGLAIAFKIINEHNGSISVSSELNVGTTFTIRIPAGKKTQVAAKEKP